MECVHASAALGFQELTFSDLFAPVKSLWLILRLRLSPIQICPFRYTVPFA